jgi:hypothetical protein
LVTLWKSSLDSDLVMMGLVLDAREQLSGFRFEDGYGVVLAGEALDCLDRVEVVDDDEFGLVGKIAAKEFHRGGLRSRGVEESPSA